MAESPTFSQGETTVTNTHGGMEYPYVTTTKGGAGWFALIVWWNPDMGGFPEPYQTGIGRYTTEAEAAIEGRKWARTEEMPFYP